MTSSFSCHFSAVTVPEHVTEKKNCHFTVAYSSYNPGYFLKGIRKHTKTCHEILHPGRESSQTTSAGVSTALPLEQPAVRTLTLPTVRRFGKETNNAFQCH